MPRTRCCSFLVVAILVLLLPVSAAAQGFGAPDGSFGQTDAERSYEASNAPQSSAQGTTSSYFLHDQLVKFLVVLGFTLAALLIVLTHRFALRRWLLLASVIVLGFVIGGVLCPISAVQNVILKASSAYLLLFLVPTIAALLVGRLFCGYVCPFGALQELLHVHKWRRTLPATWMRVLRWIPYALLVYLVVRVVVTGVLTWNGTTPFKAFFTLGGTAVTWTLSAVFAVLSLFLYRPFCSLFCPLGAWFSLVSRISPFRIQEQGDCVSCHKCDKSCASGAVSNGQTRVEACLLCGECIRRCPTSTLSLRRCRR